ncbi:MAG: pseudaminic acid cytidylyltransferase [Eubacterium sp.]|nr:pseudaminic acid cytidylyltransferase [Eubacterium sp.]
MRRIAIITARGGSKRIPRKNIREFCGKPIIGYSIEAAIKSGCFDEVMVSTDDTEIAEIAKSFGASVPFLRSSRNSDDYSTTADVIREVMTDYSELGKPFDIFCCIYPTAPFLTAKKLREAVELMDKTCCETVVSVTRFSFPPQRAFVIRNERIEYRYPEYASARSQDLEAIYHDCGQFYLCRTEAFLREHSLITRDTVPFILPESEVQDIDQMSDWIIAEAKFRALRSGDGKE